MPNLKLKTITIIVVLAGLWVGVDFADAAHLGVVSPRGPAELRDGLVTYYFDDPFMPSDVYQLRVGDMITFNPDVDVMLADTNFFSVRDDLIEVEFVRGDESLADSYISLTVLSDIEDITDAKFRFDMTVTDGSDHNQNLQFPIQIFYERDRPPVFHNLPSDIIAYTRDLNPITIEIIPPTATDSVDGELEVKSSKSDSTFAVRTTRVTFTATDNDGNTITHTITVEVKRDRFPPRITAPPDIQLEATAPLTIIDDIGQANATDYIDPTTILDIPPIITNNAPDDGYPVGNTEVYWFAEDAAGNREFVLQNILITDTTNPVFESFTDTITIVTNTINGETVSFDTPTATDIADPDVIVTSTHTSGDTFPIGDTIVTFTAIDDSKNIATATLTITVTFDDITAPVIIAPDDIELEATAEFTPVDVGTPIVSDDSGIESNITRDQTQDTFPVGVTTIIWTATDEADNFDTATQIINITDTTGPKFAGVEDISQVVNSISGTTVTFPSITATDLVDGDVSDSITFEPDEDTVFEHGTHTVIVRAQDSRGNEASTSFTITITFDDITAPTITAPPDIEREATATLTPIIDLGEPTVSDESGFSPIFSNNGTDSGYKVGNTIILWTAIDSLRNMATATQVITITDTTGPAFSGVENVSEITNDIAGTTVTFPDIVATDLVDGEITVTFDPAETTVFAPGNHTVEVTAQDSRGNPSSTSFTVTVTFEDITDPTITAPPDIEREATAEITPIDVGTPTISDDSGVAPTVTRNNTDNSFPVGVTTIEWTATDGAGNTDTDTQVITITDSTRPEFVGVENVSEITNSITGTTVTFPSVTAEDLVDGDVSDSIVFDPVETTVFAPGTHTVTVTAEDSRGNSVMDMFTVTISFNDVTAPTIIAPPDVTEEATGEFTFADVGTPTASDDSGIDPTVIRNNTRDSFPVGISVIEWTATDNGDNSATDTQIVNITDTTHPRFSGVQGVTVTTNDIAGTTVTFPDIVATDLVDGDVTDSIVFDPVETTVFTPGTHIVRLTAIDSRGNVGNHAFGVTVIFEDIIPPTIIIPPDVTEEATGEFTPIDVGSPIVSDDSGMPLRVTQNDTRSNFPVGNTVILWTVTDGADNTDSGIQTITITDTTGPEFTGVTSVTGTATDIAGTTVTYPNVMATDLVDGDVTVTFDPVESTIFAPGTHTVEVTAADSRGNPSSATFTVTISFNDITDPTITAPANITEEATAELTPITVGTPIVGDDSGVAPTISRNDTRDSFPVGVTIIEWTATDEAGNTETDTQVVTITDSTGPEITGVIDVTGTATDIAGTSVTYPNVMATDLVDGDVTVTFDPAESTTFTPGTHTVRVTAADSRENPSSATFTVTISFDDITDPTITAPEDINQEATAELTPITVGTPIVGDDSGVAPTISRNDTRDSFPVGVTIIEWTATDEAGNTETDTQVVTITDSTGPEITGVIDVTGTATDIAGTSVTYPSITATDLVDGDVTVTFDPAESTTFTPGTHTVRVTAADSRENPSSATFTVTISFDDITDPTITAPEDITEEATTELTPITVGTPIVGDDSGVAPTISRNDTRDSFPVGVTIIEWTATDEAGNTETDTQVVTITDSTGPEFTGVTSVTGTATDIAGTSVTYPNVMATDLVDGDVTVTFDPAESTTFTPGTHTVRVTAADSRENPSSATFTVTISFDDITDPTITAPEDITEEATSELTPITVGTPIVGDDSGVAPTISRNDTRDSFPVGVTTIEWTATDEAGNTETDTQVITITDTTGPEFTGVTSVTGTATDIAGTSVTYPNVMATDLVDGDVTVTFDPAESTTFTPGTHTVRVTAADSRENPSSATFTVTISFDDITDPTITAPANINQEATAELTPITVGTPIVGDDSGVAPTISRNDTRDSFPVGVTTIEWTATDEAGNTETDTQVVTITDSTGPEITGVIDVTGTATDIAGTSVTYPSITATDLVDGDVTVTFDPAESTTFTPGTHTVRVTAADSRENPSSATFTVTISFDDITDPTITAPEDINQEATTELTPITVGTPIVGDDSGVAPTISRNDTRDSFPVGVTIIEWTATDEAGNTDTDTQVVTITDSTGPEITGVTSVTGTATDIAGTSVTYPSITATDLVDGDVTVTFDPAESTTFTPGTHTVEVTAADSRGNPSSATFTVTISFDDITDPTITAPANINQEATAELTPITVGTPIVGDDSGVAPTISRNDTRDSFPVGVTIIEWTATDEAGNTDTDTQVVTITDSTGPEITGVTSVTGTATDIAGTSVTYPSITATDLVDGDVTVTFDPAESTTFTPGTHTVEVTAADSRGNPSSATFTVTISFDDITDPTITAPEDITEEATAELTPITVGTPTVSDDSGVAPTISRNDTRDSFPVGVTIIEWTATDEAGNTDTDTQVVTITDSTGPEITGVTSVTGTATDIAGTSVTYPSITATDLVDGDVTVTFDPAESTTFTPGTHTVEVTAADSRGNPSSATFTVTISFDDITDPTITAPEDITEEATAELTPITVGTPIVGDDSGVAPTISRNDTRDSFPVGVTIIEWTATDEAGNTDTDTQVVTITDSTGPEITGVTSVTGTATDIAGTTVTYPSITATDLVDGDVTVTFDPAESTTFTPGTHTVEVTAADSRGNPSSATFTVTISFDDITDPTITAPEDITEEATAELTPITVGTPIVGDDSGVAPTISRNDTRDSFPVGVTIIEWTATDEAGNTETDTQVVTITDSTGPEITGVIDVTGTATDIAGTSVTYPNVMATDLVDGDVTVTFDPAESTTFTPGTHTVEVTAADSRENPSSATFTVTISFDDITDPTITAPEDITEEATAELTPITVGTPIVGDDSGVAPTISRNDTRDSFPVGVTTIEWTATDEAGNTETDTQVVTITDSTGPEITGVIDVTGTATDIAGTSVTYPNVMATDLVDGDVTVTFDPAESTTFTPGTHTVRVTAADSRENPSSATFTVTISFDDITDPTITAPEDITEEATAELTPITVGTPIVGDDSGVAPTISRNDTRDSFPVGVTIIEWTATDEAGNTETDTQVVTITDSTGPEITGVIDVTGTATDIAGTSVTYPSITATDLVDGDVTVTFDPAESTTFTPGTHTVEVTAADSRENPSSATFTVTISFDDITDPTITAPEDITEEATAELTPITVGTPIVGDDSGVAPTISRNDTRDSFPVGVTTIEWTATDEAGNTETDTQVVTITDSTGPEFTGVTSVTGTATDIAGTSVTYPNVMATDLVDGDVTVTFDPAESTTFTPGTHTVRVTAADSRENPSSATFTVTISFDDITDPTITAPEDITEEATAELTPITVGTPIVGDDSGVAPTISRNDTRDSFPVGVTTIEWTATDEAGNTETDTQVITITDTTGPEFTGVTSVTGTATDIAGTSVTYPSITATDLVDGDVTVTFDPAESTTFTPGTHTVEVTAADSRENPSSATFTVTISFDDITDPTITAPEDITEEATAELTPITVGTPIVGDDSGVAPTISRNDTRDSFPVGVTTIEWTATDEAGNTETDTQVVTITDSTGPEFTGVTSVTGTATDIAGTSVTYPNVMATDLVDGDVTVTFDPAESTTFTPGTHTVRVTAADSRENPSSATFTVTISFDDITDPTITAPEDINQEATAELTPITVGTPIVGDDSGVAPTISRNDTRDSFPVGVTIIEWTATDEAGNTETDTQVVTITDSTGPEITGVIDVTGTATDIAGTSVTYPNVMATDLVDGDVTVTFDPAESTTFTPGTHTVRVTAADSRENPSSATFTVTISFDDITDPTITAPEDINQEATAELTPITVGTPIVGDDSGVAPTISRNDTRDSFPVGVTIIEWTATDEAGNTETDTQVVTITDSTGPEITGVIDVTGTATDIAGTSVTYPSITATDLVDGDVTVTFDPAESTTFTPGTHTVRVTAADSRENPSSATFTVTISFDDITDPTITAPANINQEATAELTPITVGTPIVGDDSGVAPTISRNDTRDSFPVGVTIIEWTATDEAGNTETDTQVVTITDSTGPEITGVIDVTGTATDIAGTSVTYPNVMATDLVDGDVTVTFDPAESTTFTPGTHTVRVTAADSRENPSSATFTVTISFDDITDPTITAPANINQEATAEFTTVTLGTATGSDDSGADPTFTNNAPTGGFPVGSTTVTWTAEDPTGNTAEDTQTVTITDNTGPTFSGVQDVSVSTSSSSGTTVQFPSITATDLVDGDVTVTFNPEETSTFTTGTTQVIVTATDSRNNANTATFNVIVTFTDSTIPTITAPDDITREATAALTLVAVGTPIASDDSNIVPTITRNDTRDSFPVGIHTIEWTATDEANNVATDTQTITITDTTEPVFTGVTDVTVTATFVNGRTVPLPTITANDLVDGPVPVTYSHDSSHVFSIGITEVTVTAQDSRGNIASTTFDVTVTFTDTDAPTITAPPDITIEATGILTQVELGDATAIDNSDVPIVVTNDAPIDGFPVGVTIVTWTATDEAELSATDTQTVTILSTGLTIIVEDQIIVPSDSLKMNYTRSGDRIIEYTVIDGHGNDITRITTGDESFQYTITGNMLRQADSSHYMIQKNTDDCNDDTLDDTCAYFEILSLSTVGESRLSAGTAEHCFVVELTATHVSTGTSSSDTATIHLLPKDHDGELASCSDSGSKDDDEWMKRPTFGISDHTQTQLVSCGYSMDGVCTDVLEYHVNYTRQAIKTNSTHDFALKAYTQTSLSEATIVFGLPDIGSPLSDGEAAITVEMQQDHSLKEGYQIKDVTILDKYNVIDYNTNNTHIEMADCMEESDTKCVQIVLDDVLFREEFYSEPFAIFAMDTDRRTKIHYMNEGLLVQGESINIAPTEIAGIYKPGNQYEAIPIVMTRIDKIDELWMDQFGNLWTKNKWSTWHQLTFPELEPRQDRDVNVMTRAHSDYPLLIDAERDRAIVIFNSSEIQNNVGTYFSYNVTERYERFNDPKFLKELQLEIDRVTELSLEHYKYKN